METSETEKSANSPTQSSLTRVAHGSRRVGQDVETLYPKETMYELLFDS